MKKTISILSIVALVLVGYSCKKNNASPTASGTVSLDLPATPYRYFSSFSSPENDAKATLGRVLFYDSHLSLNNAISCASCHKQAAGFADNTALSVGFEGKLTHRNSIAIDVSGMGGSLFWDGRESNLLNLAKRPITNHVEMGIEDASKLEAKLQALPYYQDLFSKAYIDGQLTFDRVSECLAMFMSAINSNHSRFDEFASGNTAALTAEEVQGRDLFDIKYNCGNCHNQGGGSGGGYTGGGGFGQASFKDIGLDQQVGDAGIGALNPADPTLAGRFKVPNLRNVAMTAPYMHDGRYASLEDVLEHYSQNIQPSKNLDPLLQDGNGNARRMNITPAEKHAIIAFLKTLTDYNVLTDPKFSNPFKVN